MRGLMVRFRQSAPYINKLKFKPVTYGWVYGINSENKKSLKQYASDFYGTKVLIEEKYK